MDPGMGRCLVWIWGFIFGGRDTLLLPSSHCTPPPEQKLTHTLQSFLCLFCNSPHSHQKKQAFYFLRAFLYSVPFLFPSFLFQCLLAKLCAGGQQFHKQCCLPSWHSQLKFYCGCAWFYLWHVGSSSLTRDGPRPPALGMRNLSHWTTRKSPSA